MMENDCIIWKGKTCSNGRYGRTTGKANDFMAHRDSWIKNYGLIPPGMFVCHECDNGLCINPNHLFLGTNSDNLKDCFKKGRGKGFKNQKGERNANSKLSIKDVEEIRRFYSNNPDISFKKLAERFGLKSQGHAHAIIKNKIWN